VENAGFYTQKADQDKLASINIILAVGSSQRYLTGNIWRDVLNQYWLTNPKKRDNLFAGVSAFLTEMVKPKRGVSDNRLPSIKE